jgi:hypothetical protein
MGFFFFFAPFDLIDDKNEETRRSHELDAFSLCHVHFNQRLKL